MSGVGRLMRFDGHQWRAVGDPLPPFPHVPPAPHLPIAPWVLPRELAPQAFDVVVIAEHSHQLIERCREHDAAYEQLVQQTLLFNEADQAQIWLASVEVWFGRKLHPTRPWPTSP